jgi:SAM-dependent methyltransferase
MTPPFAKRKNGQPVAYKPLLEKNDENLREIWFFTSPAPPTADQYNAPMAKGRESGMPDEAYWQSFFNPDCIISRLECSGGDVVEFGCGFGLFTVPAARSVSGTVYALDIEPEMVAATKARAADAGFSNVIAQERDFLADGCGRPDKSAAYVMLFNIMHIAEAQELLRESYRVLAAGGKAGVIHWKPDSSTPRGPSLAIRPPPERCAEWAERAGFRVASSQDLCCCSWHWGMVLEKPLERT